MVTHSIQYSCLENPIDREAWQSMGLQTVRNDWAQTGLYTENKYAIIYRWIEKLDDIKLYI